jgi:hypothetical protein
MALQREGPEEGFHLKIPIGHNSEAVAVAAKGLAHAGDEGHTPFESWNLEILGDLPCRILTSQQSTMHF